MNAIRMLAHAKINKTLHITGKREDGYHLIESIIVPITLSDILIVEKRDQGIYFTSNKEELNTKDNLIFKAHSWLENLVGKKLPARVHLMKQIPIGAGLAGGTTDGAALIKALNLLYDLNLSHKELEEKSVCLGADFPICLRMEASKVSGIGEIIEPITYPKGEKLLLINPGYPLSTPNVYDYYDKSPCSHNTNDLLPGVLHHHKDLKILLEKIKKTKPKEVSMTGSGPTFFAIYPTEKERQQGLEMLQDEFVIACETC